MKNILLAASECFPFIKTGGLADVVGALPKYIDKENFDCRVVLPKYSCMKDNFKAMLKPVTNFFINYNGATKYVGVEECELNGIHYYFIDNEEYFSGAKPYGENRWDIEKFIYFDKAVLAAMPAIGFKPDILHCHDWQAGLIPVFLKSEYATHEFYMNTKSVMTIHNLKFQGVEGRPFIQHLSGLGDYYFTYDKLAMFNDGNMLKGGLVYADAITTVSSTYSDEIKTSQYGEKLEGLLAARSSDLRGIVNGIDYAEFDPESDKGIDYHYNSETFKEAKQKNKVALQERLGLPVNKDVMMVGIVSRMTDQKGFDLINHVMEEIVSQDNIQVVLLGTGDPDYENAFKYFANKYPTKVSANIFYSDELSRKIYAASDAFLMPSLFEPCGLSQLMAMHYGTLPIVRETGGLKDTVEPYNMYEGTGTGFSFANYNAHEMMNTIRYAEHVYYDYPKNWDAMVKRAMEVDFSWNVSAKKYEEMYNWMCGE